MIRVLADANVLVSAALARDPRAPSVLLLDAALDGRVELITSPALVREIASVLARPRLRRYLSLEEAERFVADLAGVTALTADAPLPYPAVCRDPADDYLVALAREDAPCPTRDHRDAETVTATPTSRWRAAVSQRGPMS